MSSDLHSHAVPCPLTLHTHTHKWMTVKKKNLERVKNAPDTGNIMWRDSLKPGIFEDFKVV